jgi:SNF2 family DNA or RNA helicase
MKHQIEGVARLAEHPRFAMGAEQGTGKTWMLLADVEKRFNANEIDALLVIAPNGVHVNWVLKEIPTHLECPHTATFWISGASKRHQALLASQLKHDEDRPRHLIIHAMNIDAINTKDGKAHAERIFASFPAGRVAIVVDESHQIKNPAAKRTQAILQLGQKARVRRISSGTIVANSPLDLFSQYEFLSPGLLGTTSYRAFVAEFAVILPSSSPLVQDIIRRTGARGSPQIVARNADGTLKFKNLEKLSALMAPHTFRVTKDECLDLPAKIYQTHFFDLDHEQLRAYKHMVEERNWLRDDGNIDTFTALTIITKLRQITSGFIMIDGEPTGLVNSGPRLAALQELIENCQGQIIIWASFIEEIHQIENVLEKETVCTYFGETSQKDRVVAIDDFQSGKARIFLGNPAAAGMGLTLTAAETVVYYSSSFSLVDRVQSEDRCHRIGTTKHVVYIDLVARGTIDERIASALQSKKLTAETILGGLA